MVREPSSILTNPCARFPWYTMRSRKMPLNVQGWYSFIPNLALFEVMYCLKLSLPLKRTRLSSMLRFLPGAYTFPQMSIIFTSSLSLYNLSVSGSAALSYELSAKCRNLKSKRNLSLFNTWLKTEVTIMLSFDQYIMSLGLWTIPIRIRKPKMSTFQPCHLVPLVSCRMKSEVLLFCFKVMPCLRSLFE